MIQLLVFAFTYFIWSPTAVRFGNTLLLNYLVVKGLKHSSTNLQE